MPAKGALLPDKQRHKLIAPQQLEVRLHERHAQKQHRNSGSKEPSSVSGVFSEGLERTNSIKVSATEMLWKIGA